MRRWSVTIVPVLLVTIAACGNQIGSDAEEPVPPRVSAEPTLMADGTVPWVDEPAADSEFQERRLVQPGRRDAPPCLAGQLAGELKSWFQLPTKDFETGQGIAGAGMIGTVRVRNKSKQDCVLQGEIPAQVLVDGQVLPITYNHAINEEGRARLTPMGAGASADLRLDWSAPYCGPRDEGRQEIAITLPQNGGRLVVPVRTPRWPNCTSSEIHPELRSFLSSSAFDLPAFTPTKISPVDVLKLTIEPGPPVASQQRYVYRIALSNPTAQAVPLTECPGYLQELFSLGDATRPAVNDSKLYRLNCRPIQQIPPGGVQRFEMVARVPPDMTGRDLSISWKLVAPGLGGRLYTATSFTVR